MIEIVCIVAVSVIVGTVFTVTAFALLRRTVDRFGDSGSAMLGTVTILLVGYIAALIGIGEGMAWLFG